MAEAFGLAVNIATIVELSTKIAKVCLQYSKEVKNAKEEIDRVEKETLNLKTVAESASELLEGPHGATLKTSQTLVGAAQAAASRLKALDAELRPSDTRKAMRRFGVRASKWPFQSRDVEKTVRDIERYTQMISMGLQIDQTGTERFYSASTRNSCSTNYQPPPEASFDSHAEKHNPTCLPNTRVELLKELDRWTNDPSAEAVFWLNDECEQDNDIKLIINLFSSGKALKSPRLKVLLTSRPELPIRLGFSAVQAFLEYELARIRDEYNSSVSEEDDYLQSGLINPTFKP
ncbi:vegetative incompatibility protein HET-E-1 [Colletotrichum graminicola]|nr:vegetative incompatibility protein HET-E-1 [Colletotrichum graminicola]